MKITTDDFRTIMPNIGGMADIYIDPLNSAMDEFKINTLSRIAMFLAQLAHESGEFRYMEELADGTAYTNRADLGNTNENAIRIAALHGIPVGPFFKGHGPIQITGYTNHLACADALKIDCVNDPRLLTKPKDGCRSAAWFWNSHGLNEIADLDNEEAFKAVTRKINGGYNGYEDRKKYWVRAQECLGA
jgi:putative chitinase